MAPLVESHPFHDALTARLSQGLDGAGEALCILVHEASKIEPTQYVNAAPHQRSAGRTGYANGFKPNPS